MEKENNIIARARVCMCVPVRMYACVRVCARTQSVVFILVSDLHFLEIFWGGNTMETKPVMGFETRKETFKNRIFVLLLMPR